MTKTQERKTVERNIRKTNNGKFLVNLYYGYDNGVIKRSAKTYDSLKEAKEARDKNEAECKIHEKRTFDYKMTVCECMRLYITQKALQPTTIISYTSRIKRITQYPLGKKRLVKVTVGDINAYLDNLTKEGKLKSVTINGDRAFLYAVFEFAKQHEYTDKNPVASTKNKPVKEFEGEALTVEEVMLMLEKATAEGDLRLKTIIVLGAMQGLRREEIAGLQWKDIKKNDKGKYWLTVERVRVPINNRVIVKEPKTTESARSIPVTDFVIKTLNEYRREQEEQGILNEYIITSKRGKPLHPQRMNEFLNALIEKHSLKKIRLHDLRHTCCSELVEQNANLNKISKYLGHTSTRTTERVYTHLRRDTMNELTEILNGIYNTSTPDNSTEFLEVIPLKECEN